jgi:hypothetical protein
MSGRVLVGLKMCVASQNQGNRRNWDSYLKIEGQSSGNSRELQDWITSLGGRSIISFFSQENDNGITKTTCQLST